MSFLHSFTHSFLFLLRNHKLNFYTRFIGFRFSLVSLFFLIFSEKWLCTSIIRGALKKKVNPSTISELSLVWSGEEPVSFHKCSQAVLMGSLAENFPLMSPYAKCFSCRIIRIISKSSGFVFRMVPCLTFLIISTFDHARYVLIS